MSPCGDVAMGLSLACDLRCWSAVIKHGSEPSGHAEENTFCLSLLLISKGNNGAARNRHASERAKQGISCRCE
jgi:hypothetical protein